MDETEIRGVVKNGQVVLNEPLDLPDGTAVFVEVDRSSVGPSLTMTDDEWKEFTEYFTGRKDRAGFEEFMARVEASQTDRADLRRAS
jgi:hypothetical protein